MTTFKFELVSPERLVVSGDADSAVVPGSEGEFTVLPGHAPALSMLRPGVISIRLADGTTQRLYVNGGFAEVTPDSLTVLAQGASDVSGGTKEWLGKELAKAEELRSSAKDDEEMYLASAAVDTLKRLQ